MVVHGGAFAAMTRADHPSLLAATAVAAGTGRALYGLGQSLGLRELPWLCVGLVGGPAAAGPWRFDRRRQRQPSREPVAISR